MVNRKTNKVIKKNKKTRKQRNNKTKRGGSDEHKYKNVSIDVIITNGHNDKLRVEGEKRKLDFNVKSFYHFYDYLNEVDMFLKNTLNEELLAFTDPNKYEQWKATHKPKIYSYKYGYEEPKTENAMNQPVAMNKEEANAKKQVANANAKKAAKDAKAKK